MTSEPTRSASSTSAAPGLRVRIRPVWILMPARRAWMRALSSTERPCASSSSSPASSDSWLGTGSTKIAYTTPSAPISLAALLQRRGADVVAEDRHERGAVLELLEVRRALGARDAVVLARVEALALAVVEVAAHADDHPGDADVAGLGVQDDHGDPRGGRADAADHRGHRDLRASDAHAPRACGRGARGRGP